jgi:hypothetical protein
MAGLTAAEIQLLTVNSNQQVQSVHIGKRMKMLQAKSEGGTGVVEW